MLKIENTEVLGWEHAIRGMRNPMNSWEKSDSNLYHTSVYFDECNERWETDGHRFMIGPNDLDLMTPSLSSAAFNICSSLAIRMDSVSTNTKYHQLFRLSSHCFRPGLIFPFFNPACFAEQK